MERDLNACINIAYRVMISMGWGSPKLADVAGGVKPPGDLWKPRPRGETTRLRHLNWRN